MLRDVPIHRRLVVSTRQPTIAVIGRTRRGRAVAAALQRVKRNYRLVGYDRDADQIREVRKAGHIDTGQRQLGAAVRDADLVFLGEPVDAAMDTLTGVGEHARPGTLISSLGPEMEPLVTHAEEVLSAKADLSFVAGHVVVGTGRDPAAAGASPPELTLEGATWCLDAAPNATDEAVRVLGRLVRAIGAEPMYIDAREHDALVTAVGDLPNVTSAALLRIIEASPSSDDLRRLAPPDFRQMLTTSDLGYPSQVEGRRALAGWIDRLILELQRWRDDLHGASSDTLTERARETAAARERWTTPRDGPQEDGALSELTSGGMLRDLLLGRAWTDRRRGRADHPPSGQDTNDR